MFQKLLRYEHHAENYKLAIDQQIKPFGLRIIKAPIIQPIYEDFKNQYNTILYNSEKGLVRVLLEETQKVVEKTQTKFDGSLEVNYDIYDILISENLKLWTLVVQFYQLTCPFLSIPAHPLGQMVQDEKQRVKNNSVSRLYEELLSILEDLQNDDSKVDFAIGISVVSRGFTYKIITITDKGRLAGPFCSKAVFNLSQKGFLDIEIQVLEKWLDFSPVQRFLNEPEVWKDFEEFARRMRVKWYFQNESSEDFIDKHAYHLKSSWKPPPGHPGLDLLLSQIEKDIFQNLVKDSIPINPNMTKEEGDALRGLADDRRQRSSRKQTGSLVYGYIKTAFVTAEKLYRRVTMTTNN